MGIESHSLLSEVAEAHSGPTCSVKCRLDDNYL